MRLNGWLIVLWFSGFGASVSADCNRDAVQLVAALEQEALGELDELQREKAVAVIEQSCQGKKQAEAAEKNDAFTEFILNGESADKPGNKRLKRMSH